MYMIQSEYCNLDFQGGEKGGLFFLAIFAEFLDFSPVNFSRYCLHL